MPNARLDSVYGYFALKFLTPLIIERGRGATFGEVSHELMAGIPVPFCDMDEQKRIARILSSADRFRRSRQYSLELSSTLLESAYIRMFDGKSYSPLTIEELAINRVGAIRTGPFGSQLLHSEFTDRGVAVLGIDNVVNNRFEWAKRRYISLEKYALLRRYRVLPGDVLITIMATCGRCAVVPEGIGEAINTKHLCCISLDQDQCLPGYLQGAFLYDPSVRLQLEIATRGSIMDGLNMEIIKGLDIPVPPRSMQERYVASLKEVNRLVAAQEESYRQADYLFRSLLEDAFVTKGNGCIER